MAKQANSSEKYQLPMREIKLDLVKTLIFAVFTVVFLTMLHLGNVTFEDVTGLFKSLPLHQ